MIDEHFCCDATTSIVSDEVIDTEQAIAGVQAVIAHINSMEPAGNGLLENVISLLNSAKDDLLDYGEYLIWEADRG